MLWGFRRGRESGAQKPAMANPEYKRYICASKLLPGC